MPRRRVARRAHRRLWSGYYWLAVDACFQTLAEEGSRKDEVSKPTAATPFRRGRFTFASLVWFIDGRELRRAPTREELLTLKPGDGVLLKHGISKKHRPLDLNLSAGRHFWGRR